MKKLADISAFLSLQHQMTATTDLAVFNVSGSQFWGWVCDYLAKQKDDPKTYTDMEIAKCIAQEMLNAAKYTADSPQYQADVKHLREVTIPQMLKTYGQNDEERYNQLQRITEDALKYFDMYLYGI